MFRSARLLPHFISNESLIALLSKQKRSFHHLKNLNTRTCIATLNTRQSIIVNTRYLRWNSTSSSASSAGVFFTDESFRDTSINLNEKVTTQLPLANDINSTPILPASGIDANLAATSGIDVKQTNSDPPPTSENIVPSDSYTLVEKFPDIDEIVTQIGGEPSLVSQGLGGWAPPGIAQTFFDTIHQSLDVPWWIAIAIGTCLIRVVLLPLVVIAQRNAAHFNNHMPQMQLLQLKMTDARKCGNAMMAAKYANEMALFMKEKNLNPFKNMLVPMAQAPIFVSVFLGLRGMANAPIESMKTGGAFWFTNLTVTDPYFLLPVITSATLFVTIQLGAEGGISPNSSNKMTRYILLGMPIVIFPFIMNFPTALLCYWVTSNFISLGQVAVFKIPAVRKYFKIDPLVTHKPDVLPMKPKGFVNDFRDTWENTKVMKKLSEREEFDKLQFRKAGFGPLQKTYPFDPTKQTAKPRDNN
uniref:Membrane insertase YidC/Oxa/ALB C-terminal domain-containing protein n=1 Tax=Strigamia maritima TaxID=126957 RepID=T1JM00_STRMM